MPALLTRMPIGPCSRSMFAMARATAISSVTSNGAMADFQALGFKRLPGRLKLFLIAAVQDDLCARFPSPSATARPMPWLDPVISARLPARLKISKPSIRPKRNLHFHCLAPVACEFKSSARFSKIHGFTDQWLHIDEALLHQAHCQLGILHGIGTSLSATVPWR